jgi:hypothetical protein
MKRRLWTLGLNLIAASAMPAATLGLKLQMPQSLRLRAHVVAD